MEVMVRLRDLNTRQEKDIEFPADNEDVKYQFGLDDDDYDKAEFIVVDSNTDLIVEHDSIGVISAFSEMVTDVDEDVVKAIHEVTGYKARDFVDYDFDFSDFSDCSLLPDVNSKSELGQYWVNELGIQNIPRDQLEMYFDYEAYGRDIDLENQGGFSSYGYIEIPN